MDANNTAGRDAADISYLLINPPLTDPTAPYHSISYLVGASSAAGYTRFSCLDANIASLNFLAGSDQVTELLAKCSSIRSALERKRRLNRGEQLLYRYALKGVGLRADSVLHAIGIMKDSESFYDYKCYRRAVLILRRWLDALSVYGFPGQFSKDFAFDSMGVVNFGSIADLTDVAYLEQLMSPFAAYFDGPLRQLLKSVAWDVVGLSVNYISQLPCAIFMARLIRLVCPTAFVCLGGTEISDDVKCLTRPQGIWTLFPDANALVVGEGEAAFVEILATVAGGRRDFRNTPGVFLPGDPATAAPLVVKYESLASLASPRYDIWNWMEYWSPEPCALYSPTRGCYWNKCTFCDYGLNTDSPTSPSRERPLERAIQDLQLIASIARTIYLAVDAISPRYLRKLTGAIADAGLVFRWSAELRVESSFSRGLADEMKRAGCVAVSLGYESGSQRVLDLIDKGVRVDQIPGVLRDLTRAGIGVQIMGFVGFPGETNEEAYVTFDFLRRHRDYWTLAAIGDFVLTQGSIIAKRHHDFGLTRIEAYSGDDIVRALSWTDSSNRTGSSMRTVNINEIAESLQRVVDDRPFVGGIDTAHTILYFARYGQSLLPLNQGEDKMASGSAATVYYETPLQRVDEFLNIGDLREYRAEQCHVGESIGARSVLKWFSEYPTEETVETERPAEVLEIFPSGDFITAADRHLMRSSTYRAIKNILLAGRGVA